MFQGIYDKKKILLTGHTGFKGAWLMTWLLELGANVVGYSLDPVTDPNLFSINRLSERIVHYTGDIRDRKCLERVFEEESPELVIHFAAQSLVLASYENPVETFEVNAQGTVNILEASIQSPKTAAALIITTDKVYENKEWSWGYRENDRLGGKDPYSASKAMAELAVASYRQSFGDSSGVLFATARAGNVVGGGDFSENRLLPDTMKALMSKCPVQLRNPNSIRPWMHVLDPLSGYLWLGANLLNEGKKYAQSWNFAPIDITGANCRQVVERAISRWGDGDWVDTSHSQDTKETKCLRLNGEKTAQDLSWHPTYDWAKAVDVTVDWFKAYQEGSDMYQYSCQQISEYANQAKFLSEPEIKCQLS